MYHFIYKTTHETGKYYVGRHSTKKIDDGYFGSGKWVRSIKDKTKLKREIIKFCSEHDLLTEELKIINDNIGKPNCMNFNNSSIGFSFGELNFNKNPERKQFLRERVLGDKNPSKRPEIRKKMSDSQKGRPSLKKGTKMSEQARKNISESRRGIKYSEEGKRKLSESRKKEFFDGKRKMPSFAGKNHSDEYKQKMKEVYNNAPLKFCNYCLNSFHPSLFGRWHGEKCKLKYEDAE